MPAYLHCFILYLLLFTSLLVDFYYVDFKLIVTVTHKSTTMSYISGEYAGKSKKKGEMDTNT